MSAEILFATNNPGKLDEVRAMAKLDNVIVYSAQDLGLDIDPKETGETFEENARLKAMAFLGAVNSDVWIAADDTGVMINALNGEPGVHTRRWAGYKMSDQEVRDYALEKLKEVEPANRNAVFRSVVVLGRRAEEVGVFEGEIKGVILNAPNLQSKAREGLAFDQIFYVPEADQMLGDIEGTDFLTHRQRAFKKIFKYILEVS